MYDVISIHVPREGDDLFFQDIACHITISIHVPREGDDYLVGTIYTISTDFNPRPP